MKNRITIGLFFAGFLLSQLTLGQGFETPILTQKSHSIVQKKSSQGRFEDDTPLTLPFWDDFSQSRVSPDTLLWENSNNVEISPTAAIDAISLNTAVFNGIRANGSAHNSLEFQTGDTDILTSKQIALSAHTPGDNLYLSFFYEKKGNGEIPNNNDGIRLEFMNQDSIWVSNIWNISGEDVVEVDNFFQVLIPVMGSQFFSDNFRFRFVATGRQTGLFDTWLIDYVYLNEGRSATDTEYPDRTFTKPLSSTFKDYYSIPIDHFLLDPIPLLDSVGSQFVILGNENSVFPHEVNAQIMYITEDQDTIFSALQSLLTAEDRDDNITGLDEILKHKDFQVGKLINTDIIPQTAKYAEFRYELMGTWIMADNISPAHGNIDFRINDTIRNTFILNNYYAYDDGSAERGAGVNNTGSQLAYKFGSTTDDKISAIDIYFPNTIQNVQFGRQVTLKVWSNTNGFPADELFSKDILIQKVDTLNQFYRYEFNQTIAVSDTFYIGWEQLAQDRIFVGLDKNTKSNDRIYFNITGDWEQNINDIAGSLMVRPVFGEVIDADPTTGIDKNELNTSINLYPNPTSGMLYIQGNYDQIDVLSISGRRMSIGTISDGERTEVNLYGLPSGMYLIRLQKDSQIINKKIILNR